MTTTAAGWPELDLASWAPTKKSLHAYAQMLGKLRLALAPHQPNFLFTSLAHTPRGFSTGAIPYGLRTIEASVDVFGAQLTMVSSAGGEYRISLAEPQTAAAIFAEFLDGLAALDVAVSLSPIPQEVSDLTPFDRDERPAIFNPADAQRWLRVIAATNAVFERWRAHFSGRTGIQLWWGAFDFALLLFSGKRIEAPTDRGYLMRYDLDAEMMNAGFYPGDDANPAMFTAISTRRRPTARRSRSRPLRPPGRRSSGSGSCRTISCERPPIPKRKSWRFSIRSTAFAERRQAGIAKI